MYRFIPILIVLAACAETDLPEPGSAELDAAPVDLAFCKGEPFAQSVGQPVSAIQASLPERSRVLGPDDIATQDYRIDRLNVYVNGAGVIQRLTCG
ncbi:I78 family peptidase inhibitor [Ruegeria arenilitoris]|uniref:I78 family peptidase inhibitor n=1 Tax=Ruegeria arenilitoris TaxID=1173585 RepID=UPI00147CD584|nr:I78 family peptidase inhibitor [Ruegeria arenilitoris]